MRLKLVVVAAVVTALIGGSCGASKPTSSEGSSLKDLRRNWDGPHWMENLAGVIGDLPINELRLPGTHDAGTFSIPRTGATIAAAQGDIGVAQLEGLPQEFVIGAQITQDRTFTDQFDDGIRYLDFRVVCDPDGLFIVHTFRGAPVKDALDEIAAWTGLHPQEVVFLDVQKNYGCGVQTYTGVNGVQILGNERLTQMVIDAFGPRLAKRPPFANSPTTLNSLVASGTNVVPFFIDTNFAETSELWWLRAGNALANGAGMTNIWDPITTMPEMFAFLQASGPKFGDRGDSQLLLGSIATSPMFPKDTGIAKWYSDWQGGRQVPSLRDFIAERVLPEMPSMIKALAAAGYNVLSTDFYELGDWPDGATFAQLVVAENL